MDRASVFARIFSMPGVIKWSKRQNNLENRLVFSQADNFFPLAAQNKADKRGCSILLSYTGNYESTYTANIYNGIMIKTFKNCSGCNLRCVLDKLSLEVVPLSGG